MKSANSVKKIPYANQRGRLMLNDSLAIDDAYLRCSHRPSLTTAAQGADWHSDVTPEGPLPGMAETKAKVIALDYGMQNEKVEIKVRRALLYYTLRTLGLDTDPDARRPQDQQMVLLNAATISSTTPLTCDSGRGA